MNIAIPLGRFFHSKMFRLFIKIPFFIAIIAGLLPASEDNNYLDWFDACRSQSTKLVVRLDKIILYEANLPICQVDDGIIREKDKRRALRFSFKAPRAIKWMGYRSDKGELTSPNLRFDVDIWLGSYLRPNALILGVSLASGKQIYMNTLHIVYSARKSEIEIAPGLVLTTEPVKQGIKSDKANKLGGDKGLSGHSGTPAAAGGHE
jgi:hypothetical protein